VTDNVVDARLGVAASDGDLSSVARLPVSDDGPLSAPATHADNRHAATRCIACRASVITTGTLRRRRRKVSGAPGVDLAVNSASAG